MSIEGWQLSQRQGLPLEIKETMSINRIRKWYNYWQGNVYISFSGGKGRDFLRRSCETRLEKNQLAADAGGTSPSAPLKGELCLNMNATDTPIALNVGRQLITYVR